MDQLSFLNLIHSLDIFPTHTHSHTQPHTPTPTHTHTLTHILTDTHSKQSHNSKQKQQARITESKEKHRENPTEWPEYRKYEENTGINRIISQ